MSRPFTVSSPRKRKDGKTFWFKLGAAWPRDDGGFKLELDASPLPDAEGKLTLLVSPPREDGDRPQNAGISREAKADPGIDDDLPF